ncbi:MAG: transglutaminase domain-containing protein, partial [Coprobacillus sp.]
LLHFFCYDEYNEKKKRGMRMRKVKTFLKIFLIVIIGLFVYEFMNIDSLIDQSDVDNVFKSDEDYLYNYEKLDENDKKTYRYIYYTYKELYGEINIPENNIDKVEQIAGYVLLDHPEFFYIDGSFEYRDGKDNISFIPKYQYSEKEIEKYNQQIEDNTKEVIKTAKQETSPTKRAKLLYDYVVKNVEYKENKKTDQNIISSILEKKSVCAGYAREYQYLLNRSGMKSSYVVGKANETVGSVNAGEGHAWVMVNIDDDFYYCDPTWGDNIEKGMEHVCTGYFMMNSEEMLKCYKPEGNYEKTQKNGLNYFANEKIYMETYSELIIDNAVKKGLSNKTRVAEIKCSNEALYKSVKAKLENAYLGYRILSQNNSFSDNSSYACFDELRLIEIYY